MRSFVVKVKRVMRVADLPVWGTPLIVGLGIATAALEGAGMYLFIPLINALGGDHSSITRLGSQFDRLLAPIPTEWHVLVLVIGLCLSVLLKNLVGQINHFVTRYFDGQVAHRLRTRVLRQTIESCVDYRIDNRRTDIVNTIATNTWKVGTALSHIHTMFIACCAIVVFLVLLLIISPGLTLIAVAFLGASSLLINIISRHAQHVGQQVVDQNKAFGLRMWESIMGLRLIRSFSREQHEIDRFDRDSDDLRRHMLKMELLWAVPGPVSEIAAMTVIGLLIVVGFQLEIGIAALATFLALLYRVQRPVQNLLSVRVVFDAEMPAAEDVADYLDRTDRSFIVGGRKPFTRLQRTIELRGVTFSYAEGDTPALDGVYLTIPRGRTTSIVGRSGSGKSTLMDLLFRFRDPTSGEILVDGTPLPRFDLVSWRRRISIMSQTVYLLNDSVLANIGFGKADASLAEIRTAAEISGAAEFIESLPQGYDTLLGDDGFRLSGGQRQRIALARTILRDPDILLLDEATNALDEHAERLFHTALRAYGQGRTLVVIAHRLSNIEDADQVIVLDGGRVVEAGTPAQLLATDGPFARLRALQTSTSTSSGA